MERNDLQERYNEEAGERNQSRRGKKMEKKRKQGVGEGEREKKEVESEKE